MVRKKKNQRTGETEKHKSSSADSDDRVIRQWTQADRPVFRAFPGPKSSSAYLRVAFSKTAFAEVSLHARESLDEEICGVLAGDMCEDDEGLFVNVRAVVRGASTERSSRHVTFTQETWNDIHETLHREYPKLSIVGWYHSHPGFGVEFSEMDAFVHSNFFPMPAHIALVIDPLGGDIAVCVNTEDGIRYLDKLWVEGKEQRLKTISSRGQEADSGAATASDHRLDTLETRLTQVVQALDDQRRAIERVLLTLAVVICLVIVFFIVFPIYRHFSMRWEPPGRVEYLRTPLRIGDKTAYLGIEVKSVELPPELLAVHVELAKQKEEAMKERRLMMEVGDEKSESPAQPEKVPWWRNLFRRKKTEDTSTDQLKD
jgi:proteasome lid subunit RPN8/RPN11